jgi:hypothetical protein
MAMCLNCSCIVNRHTPHGGATKRGQIFAKLELVVEEASRKVQKRVEVEVRATLGQHAQN